MADSSEMDAALTRRLLQDETLFGLLPGGVFWDVAPEGADRFVLLSQVLHSDEGMFDGTAYEEYVYLVKAVVKDASSATSDAAAARIRVLLDQNESGFPGYLDPTGYGVMVQERAERVRMVEVDETNEETWQHAGGQYRIWGQPTA